MHPDLIEDSLYTRNLSQMVLFKIQRLILCKEFKVGSRLPSEKELAERFGVGKSSVREAIKMLHILGVIESRQGVGTFVSKSINSNILMPLLMDLTLQQSTSDDLVEFREMFELAYSNIAIEKATNYDLMLLNENYQEFCRRAENGTVTAEIDIEFHRLILRFTRNPFIIKIGDTVLEFLRPAIEYSAKHLIEETIKNHAALLNAFQNKSKEELNVAMHNMFGTFYRSMTPLVDKNEEAGDPGASSQANEEAPH